MLDAMPQPLNLTDARVTSRHRIPGTETLRERFFRMVRTKMFQAFRRNVQILDEVSDIVQHDEYLSRRGQRPGIFAIYELPPIRGLSIIHLSSDLTAAIVDDLFGARDLPSPGYSIPDALSAMERRIGAKAAAIFGDAMAEACAPHFHVSPKWVRTELHTALASIADAKDPLFVMSGMIGFPCGSGEMSLAIPHKGLEPFRETLASPIPGTAQHEGDADWAGQIEQGLDDVPIELAFQIGEISTALTNVAAMQVGDVLPARIFSQARVTNQGKVIGLAEYGSVDGEVGICFRSAAERAS
jgi:flagellar motor switch protein FliM